MSIIKWDSSMFSVEDPDMDEQHKMWISILNTLYDTLPDKNAAVESGEVLNAMLEYTQIHFSTEEKLLLRINYPKYREHKLVHDRFINKLKRLQQDINSDEGMLGIDLKHVLENWLKNWLVDHIINMDKQYSTYLPAQSKKC